MFNLNQTPGRTALVDGKEYLFFSGYSYLGMSYVPKFVELVKHGIDKYGWLFPSSRISNTQLSLFTEFEAELSELTGMEETICFSSGFLAGRAVLEMLQSTHQDFYSAPNTHPAICTIKSTEQNFAEWAKQVTNQVQPNAVLLFDSVNPLTSEVNDGSFLNNISANIICVIDDSHGIGLLGNNSEGISSRLPKKQNIEYIITYSLSKAFNVVGGAVSCSKKITDQLRTSAHYTASTSISPAFAFAFLNGQELYSQQRERLKQNIKFFRKLTSERFPSNLELPIFVLPAATDENKLAEAGIIISSFAYPDPQGKKINRVVLNALHTEDDIQTLVEVLS
jgi:8-amino-7-oxononanoate synthase